MATTYELATGKTTAPMTAAEGHEVVERAETFDLAVDGGGALVVNDIIKFFRIPKGARVLAAKVYSNDLDTNATPTITLNLGLTGGTGTEFLSASTVAQAGGEAAYAGHPVDMTADDIVQVKVAAGPATGAATGKISVWVSYTMPTQ